MLVRERHPRADGEIILYGAIRIAILVAQFIEVQKCLICYSWMANWRPSLDRMDHIG